MTKKEAIVRMYDYGFPIRRIAEKCGCSRQYIHAVLKRNGRK